MTNEERAAATARPLAIFAAELGIQNEDLDTQISDMICDLLHAAPGGFQTALRALVHYEAERADPDGMGPDVDVKILVDGICVASTPFRVR